MKNDIELVNRGRGLQLSTSRITVLDLVPYFKEGCSYEEILRWLPTLTPEEIRVIERYYLDHKEELLEADRRVEEYRDEQIRLQKLRFPDRDETSEECFARLRGLLEKRRAEKNGEGDSR